MKTNPLTWVAVIGGLAGVMLLAPAPLTQDLVGLMDRHEGASGWFQAVFSVLAIIASTAIAITVPRALRRDEQVDQADRALRVTAMTLDHCGKMLRTVATPLQGHSLMDMTHVARQELECRLEDLAGVPLDVLPQVLAHNVYETRAQVRIFCTIFSHIQDYDWEKVCVALQVYADYMTGLSLRCQDELRSKMAPSGGVWFGLLEGRAASSRGAVEPGVSPPSVSPLALMAHRP